MNDEIKQMTAPHLTKAQRATLRRIGLAGACDEPWPSARMIATVVRRGWAHDDGTGIAVTDAGRAALRGESNTERYTTEWYEEQRCKGARVRGES